MKRSLLALMTLAGICFGTAFVLLAQDTLSPMHPVFPLLDENGQAVSVSSNPISPLKTCGACHDTAFISEHTLHGDGGRIAAGSLPPAELTSTNAEMNCFVCHLENPNNSARLAALVTGQAEWAATATLVDTGIVIQAGSRYIYDPDAFDDAQTLKPEYISLQDPRSDNCGTCHGQVHLDNQVPLTLSIGDSLQWRTFTTGQVISPQRIDKTGANISGRDDLNRTWDVHAERVLNCVDCHYSLNNPVFAQANASPGHLVFDPRRADISEYLERPSHQFASGTDTMRSCSTCHDAQNSHEWLPYWERHTASMACETCHVPMLYAPALAAQDATVMQLNGSPVELFRGLDGGIAPVPEDALSTLVTGYQPLLLQQIDADGSLSLSPYNLVTIWYWTGENSEQPVSNEVLHEVYFEGTDYAPQVLSTFDADGDGLLAVSELVLDSDVKTRIIAELLQAQGIANPHIVGKVIPYAIHHNVTSGEWATRECQTCHSDNSRITASLGLGDRMPGNVTPILEANQSVNWNGTINREPEGMLSFIPDSQTPTLNLYLFGRDSVALVDTFGMLMVLAVSLGVVIHASLRVVAGRRQSRHTAPELRREYMYSIYERQWHWLQTLVIFGLTFTGIVIHEPQSFSLFSFAWMVNLHNIFALLLVINAALALFYHLASGEIKQFIPRPYGFFDNMVQQALYYLRGIFRGEPHPFEKQRSQKMNPIQQVTYLLLLNVLLPLQILTGALMWGAQRFPDLTQALGGLPVLAPFHTLIAWLLVTFIIVHVYMTTTGHTPLANIRAMVMGYDDVETASPEKSTETHA